MSPDTATPYPERPIRPLPKKPLRERLSPDVQSTIQYPPAPTVPLFQYGHNREQILASGSVEPPHPSERHRVDELERNYISRRNGDELDSEEDDQAYRSRIYSRPSADTPGRSYRYVQKLEARHPKPQPPASTTSSADGYDSFENTNNKKKRKIPTPGDSGLTGVHLSSNLADMGLSGPKDLGEELVHTPGSSYHSTSTGQGISGPGRGRYGRMRNGRSPLSNLPDVAGSWSNGRTTKQPQSPWPSTNETTGIISQSIATAEKYPITPSRGQENISILSEASKKSSPASTQFTFTCKSQVSPVPYPSLSSTSNIPTHPNPAYKSMSTHGTQTSPNMLGTQDGQISQYQASKSSQQPGPQKQNTSHGGPKKNRRATAREFLNAARQRREEQKWKNEHHPIAKEDQWTCEFCEYEQIFGTPPLALIRQYEIKARAQRKKEEEMRRLLAKAKAKGRKGKKGSKVAQKAAPPPVDRHPQQNQQHGSMEYRNDQDHSQGTQSDEYYEDQEEYDEEGSQDDPPPSPSGERAARRPGLVHQYRQETAFGGSTGPGIPVS